MDIRIFTDQHNNTNKATMKSALLALTAFAAAAIAADSECAADYIVEACLGSETAKLATCGTNDWMCKCYAHENIITCFNNCPNDDRLRKFNPGCPCPAQLGL